ncbi:MAG TPA: LLM class flavin-dependent oxidoreductase [Chloroflexota bacterium]|nr:LLM class flavin-dependent oxidoreductase [Chloroflexota bacterium]
MAALKFGLGLFPTAPTPDGLRAAVLAEELGFDTVWVADTHLIWRDVYVLLGAIAGATRRVAIGPGVTHPHIRHTSLTAAALASLAELAPGRVKLGMGVGDSGPANMGLPRASLAQVQRGVGEIRALLRGEEVDSSGTKLRLAYAPGEAVPVYVAGSSDRTHRFAGRIADGTFVAGAVDELALNVAAVREGEREAGRSVGLVEIVLYTTGSIDANPAVARQAVRGVVARKAINTFGRQDRLGRLDAADREPYERLRDSYDTHHHMQPIYGDLVPDRWIDRFALAGTADQVLARCRQAAADGADEIAIVFSGPGLLEQIRRFAEAVIQPLRETVTVR